MCAGYRHVDVQATQLLLHLALARDLQVQELLVVVVHTAAPGVIMVLPTILDLEVVAAVLVAPGQAAALLAALVVARIPCAATAQRMRIPCLIQA